MTLTVTTPVNSFGINAERAIREGSVAWALLSAEVQQAILDASANGLDQAAVSELIATAVTNLNVTIGSKVDQSAYDTAISQLASDIGGKADKSAVTAIDGRVAALETSLGADEGTLSSIQTLITTLQSAEASDASGIETLTAAVAALTPAVVTTSVLQLFAMGSGTQWVPATGQPTVNTQLPYAFYVDGVKVAKSRVSGSGNMFDVAGMPSTHQPDSNSEVWVEGTFID